MSLINRIKWLVAEKELTELYAVRMRLGELETWCGAEFPVLAHASRWARDIHSYPRQFKGAHGSIYDFRAYLREVDRIEK